MQVELIASELHYFEHMIPIYEKLPGELMGGTHTIREHVRPPKKGNIAMVAGWQDMVALPDDVKVIFVEHGAGQTYAGDEKSAWLPGYSGGANKRRGVILYIAPSQTVADRYHGEAVAVGCPKMDYFHGIEPAEPQSVVLTFHWDARRVSPEARTAFWYYAPHLDVIIDAWRRHGWEVYAHTHPRWRNALNETFRNLDVSMLSHDAVFNRAGVMMCDNSSLAYEFASLGRTVVSLNAPWYRRGVEHGLRFWSHVPGDQVDEPADLVDYPLGYERLSCREKRRLAVEHAYAFTDGTSSQRAADAIVERIARL